MNQFFSAIWIIYHACIAHLNADILQAANK